MTCKRAVLVPLLVSFAVMAQERTPAWELTLDQRLAVRLDPSATRKRIEEAGAGNRTSGMAAVQASPNRGRIEFVSGETHPELLLPYEIFDFLIGTAFSDDPRSRTFWRDRFLHRAGNVFDDATFWRDFEEAAKPYLNLRKEMYELSPHSDEQAKKEEGSAADRLRRRLADQWCGRRADALAAANDHFGRARFQRFLYEGVAPDLQIDSTNGLTDRQLRFIEEGCR